MPEPPRLRVPARRPPDERLGPAGDPVAFSDRARPDGAPDADRLAAEVAAVPDDLAAAWLEALAAVAWRVESWPVPDDVPDDLAPADPVAPECDPAVGEPTDGEVLVGGVVTPGVETDGVVTAGVVTCGVVTCGVVTGGVVTCGVVTGPTVTDGTVTDGTVVDGIVVVGTVSDGILSDGTCNGGTSAVAGATDTTSAAAAAATPSERRIIAGVLPLEMFALEESSNASSS